MSRLIAILLFFSAVFSVNASEKCSHCDYKIDEVGNLVFCTILENLPLSRTDIYRASSDYLINAYKDTRYTIVADSEEKGLIVGAGAFESFYQSDGFTKGVIFNAPFQLKVDAKDGRARIMLIARNYNQITLNDFGGKDAQDVQIQTTAPFSEQNKHKMYKKAFDTLHEKAHKTLEAVKAALSSAISNISSTGADENW